MKKYWLKPAGMTLGLAITLAALFDTDWGVGNYAFLFAGLFLFLIFLFHREDNLIGRTLHSAEGRFYIPASGLIAAILLFYLWSATIGAWTRWVNETSYYDMLAAAFGHGQIALEVQPDPALLAFRDESLYEPSNREGIAVLWDATLYNGKYYLYWGPAPSLFLALVKLVYAQEIGDKPLTLVFTAGTFLLMVLLIHELWRKYFPELPQWTVLLAIAFAGLVNPMPFVLFEGRIYEAAIVGAQFFLVGSFYFLFTAFHRPSIARLTWAGLFFTLAVGSRTTLIPAIGFIALVVLIWVIKTRREKALPLTLAFALPLALGAAGYGWYNHARFGSVTEFGLRYQLTSYNLYERLDETFSLSYIPPNLYKTLLNPLEKRNAFPYIFPTRWAGPAALEEPRGFYLLVSEYITGIFVGSPFMFMALLASLDKRKDLQWITAALAGSALLIFFTLQIFFFTAMRYLLDLIPTLAILAVIGFWQGYEKFKFQPVAKTLFISAAILLFAYSIVVSVIVSVSGNLELFRIYSPEALKQLTWTFNRIFQP